MASELREIIHEGPLSVQNIPFEHESGLLGAAVPPGYDGRLTYYLSSDRVTDVEDLPDWLVGNVVNLKSINDISELTAFFNAVNAKLPNNGMFVGCVETNRQVKERLRQMYPSVVACVLYGAKRILARLSVSQKVRDFFSRSRRAMFSKAEVVGRLAHSGYVILDYREIDHLSYFFAIKSHPPSTGCIE